MMIDYYCPPANSEWDDALAQVESCDDCSYLPLRREIDEYIIALDTLEFPQEATAIDVKETIRERFAAESAKWERETEHLSSPTQMMMHPSYQAILGMANDNQGELVRLMINDLKMNRRLWFWALSFLTKENPIKPSDAGNLNAMIKSWTKWADKKGIS